MSQTMGLLFIPDISGFTRFVSETEIDHSQRIIQELLEAVIDANRIGLEVSEVEGDAVLFFRFGANPDLSQLCGQVEEMFRAFHARLDSYVVGRFCQCRACDAASNLTLKIITHYGEFTSYQVRSFEKLIGKAVIVAHQLLKNDVDEHEYWLVTSDLLKAPAASSVAPWIRWNRGVQRTDGGEVSFQYTPLTPLRQKLAPATPPNLELAEKTKMFSVSREYAAHIITMLHATGDPRHRNQWYDGVRSIADVSDHLPRIGDHARLVTDAGQVTVYASSYSFRPDRIVFGETDRENGTALYFTLEALAPLRTRVTVDYYIRRSPWREWIFRLTKRKRLEASLEQSLTNLEGFAKELKVPVEY